MLAATCLETLVFTKTSPQTAVRLPVFSHPWEPPSTSTLNTYMAQGRDQVTHLAESTKPLFVLTHRSHQSANSCTHRCHVSILLVVSNWRQHAAAASHSSIDWRTAPQSQPRTLSDYIVNAHIEECLLTSFITSTLISQHFNFSRFRHCSLHI